MKTMDGIYENNQIAAKLKGQLTEPIDLGIGIRQSNSLLPTYP